MAKKHAPSPTPLRTPPARKPSLDGIPVKIDSHSQPSSMIFLNWIAPPIGVNINNVSYKVSLMSVGVAGGGQLFVIPFAEPFAWNPLTNPTTLCQYQLTSTLSSILSGTQQITDPGLDHYETMTLTQSGGGLQTIRSRVFVPPQSQPFPGVPIGASVTAATPSLISVSGVTDSTNTPQTIQYLHFLTSDQYGPTDLFLQQPWPL